MPQVNNPSQNIKLRASLTHIALKFGRVEKGLKPKKIKNKLAKLGDAIASHLKLSPTG